MRFLPAGDTALLLELDDLAHTMALYRVLQAQPIAGVHELVPAARTLLVHYRPAAISAASLMDELRARAVHAAAQDALAPVEPGRLVEIPVHYTGEDLPEVAQLLGITVAQVIERHTAQPYSAAFAGFAPGFVYLAGGHPSFQIPRRTSPRTKVPAGSVALGGAFSAVYPSASPGGWQLLGVTEVPMWDLARTEPAFIQPGFRVQFRDAAKAAVHTSLPARSAPAPTPVPTTAAPTAQSVAVEKNGSNRPPEQVLSAQAAIEFISAGLQTLVQDSGRHGMAGLGISPSGALDAGAMRQANRLVGNPVEAPVLENILGQLQLRSHGATTVAVTGAQVALTLRNPAGRSMPVPVQQAVALDDGDVLTVHAATAGVRCYLAVRGGWQVAPVLGSCATDTLAHIGPAAVQAGARLAVGAAIPALQLRAVQAADAAAPALPQPGALVTLDVVLGPRTDWFTPAALQLFTRQEWQVTPQSNRIGMRIHGAQPLERSRHDELPSEGTVAGAIQVPISGQPVLFLADHPLTGGYPVIAAVASHHLDLAAQIPVGCRVQFRVIPSDCGDQLAPAPAL